MALSTINQNKSRHLISTICILSIMAGILGLVGYSISGATGLVASVIMVLAGAFFTPRMPSHIVMRMYRARALQPYEAPRLYHVLAQLARRANMNKVPRLYYIPRARINAFATGSSADPAIAVTKGLLSLLSTTEIAGILGHEMSHIRNNDTGVMSFAGLLHRLTHVMSILGLMLFLLLLPLILMGKTPVTLTFLFVLILAPTVSALLQLALSRTREFEADLGSAELLGSPYPLAKALQTLETVKKRSWFPFFLPRSVSRPPEMFSTHPDTDERIRRLVSLETFSGKRLRHTPTWLPVPY